jgi:hypothetical protein
LDLAKRVGLAALLQQIKSLLPQQAEVQEGHAVTTETSIDPALERVFVVAMLHERLVHVFMHSLKHSLQSAF